MADNNQISTYSSPKSDILKSFQLDQLSISEKSSKDWGLKITQKIWAFSISGLGGYFWNRNQRFQKNADYAYGRINVQRMFQDRFQLLNGKQNYIRLDWNTLQLVNRIISGLVGRWMARNEKIQCTAIDSLSQKDKQDEYDNIAFIIQHRKELEQLQQSSGVQMIPNDDLPRDKEELNLWQQQFQRTPEEIQQEMACNDVLRSNGWYDVLKDLCLRDSAVKGLIGTETTMDKDGVIHVEWLKPDNIIYSMSDYDDFRDSTWRGYCPDMKISTLRRKYGKEFNPDNPNALDEEQIWKIAQTAKEYKSVTNLSWDNSWTIPFNLRPYDEWNVRSMTVYLKTTDTEPYTITTTKTNTTYVQKGNPTTASGNPRKANDNQKVTEDTNINIYKGVYLPDNNILLEWGIQTNMIRPQDPKESGNAEFPISLYMYQNYNGRNLALPEKIQAAIDGMMLALLKIQQVVARLVPTGWAIDETALQGTDYGLGDANNQVDQARYYFQTGTLYYRGIDAEGNRINPPIQELANNGFIGQMQGLIANYQFWYQTLKDELGEDPNAITAALQPRVANANVEASQQASDFATDYMYMAYAELMKITSRKISCLIKDSIAYGSMAYRNIVKEDISDRVFTTEIKFMSTDADIQVFNAMLQTALASNPELVMFLNQFQAMQMAKEDYKLAWIYYNQCLKKMLIWKQAMQVQNQQATIQGQIQSAQAAEQAKQQTEQMKGDIDIQKMKIQAEGLNKSATIQMVAAIVGKGGDIPPQYQPFVSAVLENVMLPMMIENEQIKGAVLQQMQQAQQYMAQQQAQQQQPQLPPQDMQQGQQQLPQQPNQQPQPQAA